MKRDPGETRTQRRKFLRDLAAAGGLAAVASSAGPAVASSAAKPASTAKRPTGYRVTAHVSKYYDKARI
ncbi:MAG TPA: twin-arginine translocation signal domain-containing protein [Steroidobacteraceae bacterium]